MAEDDALKVIRSLAETAGRRIKLAPGVIGKSSLLYLGTVVLWGIVLWRLTPDNPLFDGLLISCALMVTLLVRRETRRMRDFAVANPALALMEGADITEFKRFEEQAKGLPAVDRSPVIVDPTRPPAIDVPRGSEADG
jgi:hypothetical protein